MEQTNQKRPVLAGALVFVALAIGSFLRDGFYAVRSLVSVASFGDTPHFYDIQPYLTSLLLFLAALFLLLCIAKQYPKSGSAALGGLAFLFTAIACFLTVLLYVSTAPSSLFKWPRVGNFGCCLVAGVLFLISAILAFARRRFAAVGTIGAVFYMIYRFIIFSSNLSRMDAPGMTFATVLMDPLISLLFHLFFGLALMLFALKCRPQRG